VDRGGIIKKADLPTVDGKKFAGKPAYMKKIKDKTRFQV
jgi:hypothetical protein